MFEIAQKVIDVTKKNGFSEAEVYIEEISEETFELKNSRDFSKGASKTTGMALRLIKDNDVYFANTTLDINDFSSIKKLIVEASGLNFSKKADAQLLPKATNNFIHESLEISNKQTVKNAVYEMDGAAKIDNRIKEVKSSSIAIYTIKKWVANSYGTNSYQAYNINEAQVSVLAKDKVEEVGWFSNKAFNFRDLDFTGIARQAAQRAIEKLSPTTFSTKKVSVILSNEVMSYMLRFFFNMFSGLSFIEKTTRLELGKKMFSSNVDILDDPVMESGTKFFIDDEGILKKPTVVVRNGEVKSFLHNTYTSSKLSQENTANAKRGSFVNPVKIGPANFYIKPSNKSFEDLISSVDGIYVTEIMGMHMANPISGDFSLGINGFLMESGAKVHYIKASTFADNFYSLLNKVVTLSNDLYFTGSVGSPSIWVSDCVIGGVD